MKPAASRRRRLLAGFTLAALAVLMLVLFAVPAAADTLSNISPAAAGSGGGWMGRYPISRYQIDQYFPAISVGLFSGVDVSGLMPMVAYAAAQVIWLLTAFISNTVITVFQFAFHLNLLTGEGGSGGALAPISQAIHNIYTHTFGQPWLIAAVAAVGIWAMWKALLQRRYAQTTAALATSLIYCVVALGIVARPAQTITPLSNLSNEVSEAFLSLTDNGSISEGGAAQQQSSGQLFQTLVLNPWTVLEFGGIEHCVDAAGHSTPVQPLSANAAENAKLAGELEEKSEVAAEGKQCINNREKYASHFLAYPYQSPDRNAEYEALKAGETSKLPSSDPAKNNGSYPLGKADKPAAEAAGKGGQYERLLLSIVIFAGELGFWILLGALAAGVILAQIVLLGLLMFAPVVLPIAVLPGRGHAFFTGWVQQLLGFLARKAIYSLLLAVLLAVCQALQQATSSLGWLMSFLLVCALTWSVLLQRHALTSGLTQTLTGAPARQEGRISRLQDLLAADALAQLTRLKSRPATTKNSDSESNRSPAASVRQPHPPGSTTPTSSGSRGSTTAPTSRTSVKAASAAVGAGARNFGASTPTTAPATPRRDAKPVRSAGKPSAAADANRQQSPPVTSSSGAAAAAAQVSSSSTAAPRAATRTPSVKRAAGKPSAASSTSQPPRPAPGTATPLPPPSAGSPAAPSTPTSSTAAAKTTMTTPVRRQASGPKEAK